MTKLLPVAKIFISSTFADMQAERDILSRIIMPPLRHKLLERGIDVREIDLRWGVTETMALDSGAVGICLDGVQECSPLFLGMLGHRYGWVPGDDVIGQFGGTRKLPALPQCSLTELEMRFALETEALSRGQKIPIMLRSERLSKELGFFEDDEAGCAAIDRLRRSLERHPAVWIVHYDTLEEFEAKLQDALTQLLEPVVLKEIRRAKKREGSFVVPRLDITRALEKYVHTGRPMLVYGLPGTGKSTVLEIWGRNYEEIIRLDGRNTSLSGITDALVEASGQAKKEESSFEIAAEAIEHLGHRPGRRAVVIDHFEASGLTEDHVELSWLPGRISKNLALVVATCSERLLQQAEELGWDIIEMPPLDDAQVEAIGLHFLSEYGKHLDETQTRTLLGAPWTSDLSSMLLVLSELRRYGSFETLDVRLSELAKIADRRNLIEELILGLEASLRPPWNDAIRALIVAVAISWRGLTVDEIRYFAGSFADPDGEQQMPLAVFFAIYINLRTILVERGNRIDLQHGAAEYWVDELLGSKPGFGARVAEAMESSFVRFDPRRAAEEYPRLALFRDGRSGLVRMLQQPSRVLEVIRSEPRALLSLLETFDENELALLEAGWEKASIADDERRMLQDNLESLVAGDDEVLDSTTCPTAGEIAAAVAAAREGDTGANTVLTRAATEAAQGQIELSHSLADEITASLEHLRESAATALTQSACARSLLAQGSLLRVRGFSKQALKRLSDAENLSRREGLAMPLCRALCEQAKAALDINRFAFAREKSAAALDLARAAHMGRLEALAMDALIETEHRQANYSQAYELAREYLERANGGHVSPFRARRALDRLEAG